MWRCDIDVIQSNLCQDLDNLYYWFCDNELIFKLKKGNPRCCCLVQVIGWICFKAVKSSSWSMVLPSIPLHVIGTSVFIWTRHLILTHIFMICSRRQQQEWTSSGVSVLVMIPPAPYEFTNRWLCQYLRIAGIISLGWSESRKRMICPIETRSLEIISPRCSQQNYDL